MSIMDEKVMMKHVKHVRNCLYRLVQAESNKWSEVHAVCLEKSLRFLYMTSVSPFRPENERVVFYIFARYLVVFSRAFTGQVKPHGSGRIGSADPTRPARN